MISEEALKRECADFIEVEVPKGSNPVEYLEHLFGTSMSGNADIDDADVEKSIEIVIK